MHQALEESCFKAAGHQGEQQTIQVVCVLCEINFYVTVAGLVNCSSNCDVGITILGECVQTFNYQVSFSLCISVSLALQ